MLALEGLDEAIQGLLETRVLARWSQRHHPPVGSIQLLLDAFLDAFALLGWTMSLGAVLLLMRLPVARLRGALVWGLPVLVLVAGGWIAVNARESAVLRRAWVLASDPTYLSESQRGQAFLYLAQWSSMNGRDRDAALFFEQSYGRAPTPDRGLLAAHSWVAARDTTAGRRMLKRIRDRGGADSLATELVEKLEAEIGVWNSHRSIYPTPSADSLMRSLPP